MKSIDFEYMWVPQNPVICPRETPRLDGILSLILRQTQTESEFELYRVVHQTVANHLCHFYSCPIYHHFWDHAVTLWNHSAICLLNDCPPHWWRPCSHKLGLGKEPRDCGIGSKKQGILLFCVELTLGIPKNCLSGEGLSCGENDVRTDLFENKNNSS